MEIDKETREAFEKFEKEQQQKFIDIGFTEEELHKRGYAKIEHGVLKVTNYLENVRKFHKVHPFFYDKVGIFWLWNSKLFKWEIVDEIDIMNAIEKELVLSGDTVTGGIKSNYLETFKRIGRMFIPKEAPVKWIQFKDHAFSLNSKNIYKVEPNYFFTNPIPWELGINSETPVMDKLIEEWVGKENVPVMYDIIAYCVYRDYPLHNLFCFIGCGRNGKSQFQRLLIKFIGNENVCSTELDTLTSSRFESAKLYKKLLCSLGETNFGILQKTSIIKKLTGQDLIGYEFKNKKPFDDINYAKIIINSNSLPTSNDTSEGFYRRWIIIDFPNTFPEGNDVISTIPDIEYNNLATKITQILPDLIKTGKFHNQGTIEDRKQRYIMASNPLPHFITTYCESGGPDYYVRASELYNAYCKYLRLNKKRTVSRKEFYESLNAEGLESRKTSKEISKRIVGSGPYEKEVGVFESTNWIEGVRLKENCVICANCTDISNSFPIRENQVEKSRQNAQLSQNIIEEIK